MLIDVCRKTDGKPTFPIHIATFVLRTMQPIHFAVNTRISTRGYAKPVSGSILRMIKTSRPSQVGGVHSCDGIVGIATTARFKAIIIIASVVCAVGDTVNSIILE